MINPVSLGKPILPARADKVGSICATDEDCFPDKTTVSARTEIWVFLDKPGLSERNPLYLQIMWVFST